MTTPAHPPETLRALRSLIDRTGKRAFALRYQLNPRTVERIHAGKRPAPAPIVAAALAEWHRQGKADG